MDGGVRRESGLRVGMKVRVGQGWSESGFDVHDGDDGLLGSRLALGDKHVRQLPQ